MVEKVFERVCELIRVFSFYFTVRDKWELNPFMDTFSIVNNCCMQCTVFYHGQVIDFLMFHVSSFLQHV